MAKYPVYATGQRITADLLTLGQMDTAIKAVSTSRNSTVVLASDPDLTLSGAAGTYRVVLDMVASGAAVASGGDINVQWTYTGTLISGYRLTGGASDVTQDPLGLDTTRWRAFQLGSSLTLGYPTSNTANDLTRITELAPALVFSTSWTLTVQWCQNTSNATDTVVYNGSTFSATRLA